MSRPAQRGRHGVFAPLEVREKRDKRGKSPLPLPLELRDKRDKRGKSSRMTVRIRFGNKRRFSRPAALSNCIHYLDELHLLAARYLHEIFYFMLQSFESRRYTRRGGRDRDRSLRRRHRRLGSRLRVRHCDAVPPRERSQVLRLPVLQVGTVAVDPLVVEAPRSWSSIAQSPSASSLDSVQPSREPSLS